MLIKGIIRKTLWRWKQPRRIKIFLWHVIHDRILTGQIKSKWYSYCLDLERDLEFLIRDHDFLRVSLMKRVMRFRKKGKLSPRYVSPLEILERVGTVVYRLALPRDLSLMHPVFHVSMLRKYLPNQTRAHTTN